MAPAPLGKDVVAPLAEPVLLCGNVWVQTTYVLPGRCYKACVNKGHSPTECITKCVPLCASERALSCTVAPLLCIRSSAGHEAWRSFCRAPAPRSPSRIASARAMEKSRVC
jgi:hypothetical protein